MNSLLELSAGQVAIIESHNYAKTDSNGNPLWVDKDNGICEVTHDVGSINILVYTGMSGTKTVYTRISLLKKDIQALSAKIIELESMQCEPEFVDI